MNQTRFQHHRYWYSFHLKCNHLLLLTELADLACLVFPVFLDKELIASGLGTSKQEAQTEAAEAGCKIKGWKGPKVNVIEKNKK